MRRAAGPPAAYTYTRPATTGGNDSGEAATTTACLVCKCANGQLRPGTSDTQPGMNRLYQSGCGGKRTWAGRAAAPPAHVAHVAPSLSDNSRESQSFSEGRHGLVLRMRMVRPVLVGGRSVGAAVASGVEHLRVPLRPTRRVEVPPVIVHPPVQPPWRRPPDQAPGRRWHHWPAQSPHHPLASNVGHGCRFHTWRPAP